ncbi:MAG: 16S rRNA (uracil(1498)-N(3))-methyltransferase [Candidatus Tumulicola sp.]
MPARRFFVEGVRETGACVAIAGSDARKIVRVLRLTDGDAIEVVDSAGQLFAASVAIDGTRVRATLDRTAADDADDAGVPRFDVAQALPKGTKMDFVVEKTTELGANAILPFCSERTIARDAGAARVERWRRLAKTSAQQCGRRAVPVVRDVLPAFDSLLERFKDYDAVLFPWELAPHAPLRERLPELIRDAHRVLIVVGPEGGFTHDEAEAAQARGASLLWMGPRILRTETAAMALLAIAGAFAQSRNPERPRRT